MKSVLFALSVTLVASAADVQNSNSPTISNNLAHSSTIQGTTGELGHSIDTVASNTPHNPPVNRIELKDCLPFATSLFGAFFGALGAYLVGRFKEKRDEEKRRHTALLNTQYALFSQWNILEDLRRNFLEPVRQDLQRHHKQLNYFRVVGELKVPFDELTFVIDSSTPNLLQEIHIAEKRFSASVDLLNNLNQKRLEIQDKYPPKVFDAAIGKGEMEVPRYEIYRLKALTDLLYDEVDKAIPDLTNTNSLLFAFIKKNLKGRKAAQFVSVETQMNQNK